MTRKGVVSAVHLDAHDAAVAAAVIAERTEGVDLSGTKFAALPAFGRKLAKAVKRRRKDPTKVVLFTLDRDEAWAGYDYLMLFSHEDMPASIMSFEDMTSVNNVAIDIATALVAQKGAARLDREEVEQRIRSQGKASAGRIDDRFVRRLKKRAARDDAFWGELYAARREPIRGFPVYILMPRRNTGN